ncbi:L-methionine/branched-chain amino acid transporter [Neisseria sp. Ec49-e6-T10]|uniref:L-methionine/branched-chain amino acid transporter n=1 Tax=Neisseria sp. Ec49-e6-T10 TaxID=3140744 RepID=UPI003EC1133F
MNHLKQELGLWQGVGLLSTSLLGTGVFAVPALAAGFAGSDSLWAWPILLIFVFPIAITFATLGRYYPHAGGAAHFVQLAFGPRMAKVTAWLFLSVIPVGLPAALHIASGFWQVAFGLSANHLLWIQLGTIFALWLLGMRSAGASANLQTIIALLIIGLIILIWWGGKITPAKIPWTPLTDISLQPLFSALSVMFWCFVGLEAFAHLASEFKNPKRDFPRALLIGLLIAGGVYWACTVAILIFHTFKGETTAVSSIPAIMIQLFGPKSLWIACIIGYLACFASINIYTQSFARLVWSQAQENKTDSKMAKLSQNQVPLNALSVVLICCLLSSLLAHIIDLSLDSLLIYANGIFILIYLFCMLSGIKLLEDKSKLLAIVSSLLCIGLLLMLGWHSLYAIIAFMMLYIIMMYKK